MFDLVRLPNLIELNPRIEFDWVRLSKISERAIYYAGLTGHSVPKEIINITLTVPSNKHQAKCIHERISKGKK